MDKAGSDNHQQVRYYGGKEDEADTVAFADLNTDAPKIVANGGQGPLQVLYRHDRVIGLMNPLSFHSEIEIFTIFLDRWASATEAAGPTRFGQIEVQPPHRVVAPRHYPWCARFRAALA
jgi:hypothetical protein